MITILRGVHSTALHHVPSRKAGNLYEVLSQSPGNCLGRRVYQTRWRAKGITGCYWEITKAQFKCEGKHGKAWGQLHWRGEYQWNFTKVLRKFIVLGKVVTEKEEERVRGALKYNWQEGVS